MRISYLDVHESQYKHLTINTPSDTATKIKVESKLQVKMLGLHCCVIFPCVIWSVSFLFPFKLFTIINSNTDPLKNRAGKIGSRIEHLCAKGLFESGTCL